MDAPALNLKSAPIVEAVACRTKRIFRSRGFFNQHSAIESATGNAVNITMATQPLESDKLPVILDIEAYHVANMEPTDWAQIVTRIQSLRRLKNLVVKNSLTDQCLNLFQ